MADLIRKVSRTFGTRVSSLLAREDEPQARSITYTPGDEIKGRVCVRHPSESLDCHFDVEFTSKPCTGLAGLTDTGERSYPYVE